MLTFFIAVMAGALLYSIRHHRDRTRNPLRYYKRQYVFQGLGHDHPALPKDRKILNQITVLGHHLATEEELYYLPRAVLQDIVDARHPLAAEIQQVKALLANPDLQEPSDLARRTISLLEERLEELRRSPSVVVQDLAAQAAELLADTQQAMLTMTQTPSPDQ